MDERKRFLYLELGRYSGVTSACLDNQRFPTEAQAVKAAEKYKFRYPRAGACPCCHCRGWHITLTDLEVEDLEDLLLRIRDRIIPRMGFWAQERKDEWLKKGRLPRKYFPL